MPYQTGQSLITAGCFRRQRISVEGGSMFRWSRKLNSRSGATQKREFVISSVLLVAQNARRNAEPDADGSKISAALERQ